MSICIVGVAGGSGSGKTTFARRLSELLGPENCDVIAQDSYYIDQSAKFDHDGGSVNFDHPSALDFELLGEHLRQLRNGDQVNIPIYDFATHSRKSESIAFQPKRIVFVDGILIFSQKAVIPHLDHKIFVDCPEALRFERRLDRDVKERGRTPEGVKAQFAAQVKPMHDEFVEPSKAIATDIVNVENFDVKINDWIKKLRAL